HGDPAGAGEEAEPTAASVRWPDLMVTLCAAPSPRVSTCRPGLSGTRRAGPIPRYSPSTRIAVPSGTWTSSKPLPAGTSVPGGNALSVTAMANLSAAAGTAEASGTGTGIGAATVG